MLTPAQRRALKLLAAGSMPEAAMTVERVQLRVLLALAEVGLAKFQPYGKPPSWAITADGRAAVS